MTTTTEETREYDKFLRVSDEMVRRFREKYPQFYMREMPPTGAKTDE